MSENKINTADVEKSSEVVNTTESTQKTAVSTKVTDKPKKVKKPNELLKVFTNGIIKDNALLVMLLGLCPLFPSTTSINNAIGMSVAVLFVLFFSNIIISSIRKIVPSNIRVPVYIVVIATLVTIVELLMKAFTETLYEQLSVFISLIVVNCIILGRAEAFASKNSIGKSALDALGISIGFAMVLLIVAFFREVIGTGGITFVNPFTGDTLFIFLPLADFAVPVFVQSFGGFVTFGLVLGVFTTITMWNNDRKIKKEQKEKLALQQAKGGK